MSSAKSICHFPPGPHLFPDKSVKQSSLAQVPNVDIVEHVDAVEHIDTVDVAQSSILVVPSLITSFLSIR